MMVLDDSFYNTYERGRLPSELLSQVFRAI